MNTTDPNAAIHYKGRGGTDYQLGRKIGAGGEGTVYRLKTHPGHVAKIFHAEKKDPQYMQRKIEAMLELPIRPVIDQVLRVAWPEDLLFLQGEFVGYVMPEVEAPYGIYYVYRDDAERKKFLPGYTWKYSVQYAYNLSWVVWYLHLNGIVIGDMNMKNVRISDKGQVVLIDCDSFDITNPRTKEHFPCTVGLQEMLAPELQKVGELVNGTFTKESDNFSLAIHIFRLLMKNADPFGAKLLGKRAASKSEIDASKPIVNGECLYVRKVQGKRVPDWAPPFLLLPENIREGFRRTFDYTALTAVKNIKNRTTAEEWNRMLLPLALQEPNANLARCSSDMTHIYPRHNTVCPWCGAPTRA